MSTNSDNQIIFERSQIWISMWKIFLALFLCFVAVHYLFFSCLSPHFKKMSFFPHLFLFYHLLECPCSPLLSLLFLCSFRSMRFVLSQQPLLNCDFCILFSFHICLHFVCVYWSFGVGVNKNTRDSQHHTQLLLIFLTIELSEKNQKQSNW